MRNLLCGFDLKENGINLKRTQLKALLLIDCEQKTSMSHLSMHLDMEKGSFTSVVDSLARKGLIRRKRDPKDRRKVYLTITEKGDELLHKSKNALREHVATKTKKLSSENRARLIGAINDLYEISSGL